MTSVALDDTVFLDSIGVNTHLDKPNETYADTAEVETELRYLGVENVRDTMASQYDSPLFVAVAAATGVKFDIYLSYSSFSLSAQINEMLASTAILRYVEGPSEADTWPIAYAGLTGYAAIAAAQQALCGATETVAGASGIGVIGPSYGNQSDFALATGTGATSDFGNTHEYFGTGNPPGGSLPALIANAQLVSGSDPLIASEAGYYTGSSPSPGASQYAQSGVDQLVQAKYDLTLLFDDWNAGMATTYLYDLMDDAADPGNTDFNDHYGLFNADGTPKLAAVAVHDLVSILSDSGTSPLEGTLGYQITGLPSTGHSLLMEKSTGVFDLALWNDIRLWSATAPAEISNPVVPVTVDFGQLVETVTEFDPLTGTLSVQSWSNVQAVTLDLPDHPVILEVTPFAPGAMSLDSFVLPETVAATEITDNLWSQLIANATEANPNRLASVVVSAVGTSGTAGVVTFDAATQTLTYQAPAYDPFNPTDSFTYSLTDGQGDCVTGTVTITENPPPATTYGTIAGATLNAPSSAWALISMAAGETLDGNAQGGDSFVAAADTSIYATGSSNVIRAPDGDHYVEAGGSDASVTLGNGNNTISLSGIGDTVTTGNGNNVIWKPVGDASITMGSGNQQITVGGTHNAISIGSGTSTINAGNDAAAAGYEQVTVGGGTNTVNIGGADDAVLVAGGTGNSIVATGGAASITIDAGSNTINAQAGANAITLVTGNNSVAFNGDANTITGGSGSDTIWAAGNADSVVAGSGAEAITTIGQGDIVDVTHGTDVLIEDGTDNTIIPGAPGGAATQINGNVIARGDVFDLRVALAATSWDGYLSDLSNYLGVRSSGAASIISIDPDGAGSAAPMDIAVLNNSANLTYQALLDQAILPPLTVATLTLKQGTLSEALSAGQPSANLWSQIIADGIESNPDWMAGLTIAAAQTAGTTGALRFDGASQTLIYNPATYNPLEPNDSFTYTLSDGHGDTVTGSVAITETGPYSVSNDVAVTTISGGYKFVAGNGDDSVSTAASEQNLVQLGSGGDDVEANGNDTILGGSGAETIHASASVLDFASGPLSFFAYGGSATVVGSGVTNAYSASGSLVAFGGIKGGFLQGGTDGNNGLIAAAGDYTLIGGGNGDLLVGGATGNDLIEATGSAAVFAGGGSDTVMGGTGPLTTIGGTGTVVVTQSATGNAFFAGPGCATVNDDAGLDYIIGNTGNIVVNQIAATDVLYMSSGSSTLNATAGNTSYAVLFNGAAGGELTINGYQPGQESVLLGGYAANEAPNAIAHQNDSAAGALITFSDGSRILFAGVSSVDASIFG